MLKAKLPLQKKNLIILITAALCFYSYAGESFRVHKTNILELSSAGEKSVVLCGINDAVAIHVPEDNEYLEGIELSIKIPQIVANWRDSVAWSFYTNITPVPQEKRIDYNGQRQQVYTFPNRLSLNLKIPLKKETSIKKDAYSTLYEQVLTPENGYIFLRMQLAMKGTDDDITSARFEISARPILIDRGKLSVRLSAPDSEDFSDYTCYVDEVPCDISKPILLNTGNHSLDILSQKYRNEHRSFTIEQAKTTSIEINFRDIKPVIRLGSPQGTSIYLDGNIIPPETEMLTVTPGDHILKINLGGYEIVKNLTCVNGMTYDVAVNLEAVITEAE